MSKNIENKKPKRLVNVLSYTDPDDLVVGIDEAGRGCLAGRVYAAAVIWPVKSPDSEDGPNLQDTLVKDSKKLTPKQREMARNYIMENAVDYGIGYATQQEIDSINILQANFLAMHRAIDQLSLDFDLILVDGDKFKIYEDYPHQCVIKGDDKFYSIAAASILAKTSHDKYVREICEKDPTLDEKYGWLSNMCYASEEHREGIIKHGITKYHRQSFGICKEYNLK